jgi:hypothetical protein
MGTLMRHVTAVASPCAGKVVMVVVVVVVKFQYLCIGNRLAIPSNSSSPSQSKKRCEFTLTLTRFGMHWSHTREMHSRVISV